MGRFKHIQTGVVVTVDDTKDDRFAGGLWAPEGADKPPVKKTASTK